MAAYRALIEAAPATAIDSIDNRAVVFFARRAHTRDLRKASDWARQIKTPSRWYATDGTHRFYYFRKRKTTFLPGWNSFARVATTVYGDDAAAVFILHGGQITDRRPGGWVSASTLAGARYGGLEGGPRDWGWRDNEDLDLDIRQVERMRAADRDPYITGSLHQFGAQVEHFSRAMAGAR
jgi:hypothetical protein